MNRFYIAFLICFLFQAVVVNAQNDTIVSPKVEVSKNKVRIDGKAYFVHIVQSGQTLYSISKAYGVTQSEVAIANPDIYAGLKVGQALKIPVKSKAIEGNEKFIYHIVKRKETLFGISRAYNVTVDEIIANNPEVKDGLQVSQVLLIPRKVITPVVTAPAQDSMEFIMHEVQPREGLFAISRQYGVDVKLIEQYNREAIKDGVKLGTTLRIPVKPLAKQAKQDTIVPKPVEILPCQKEFDYNGEPFNIALLLPFTQREETEDSEFNDEVESNQVNIQTAQKPMSALTRASLEFYQGLLLAIDSMKKEGVSVNLSVFDIKNNPSEIRGLVSMGVLNDENLVFGPLSKNELLPLISFSDEQKIPVVSPFYNGPTEFNNHEHLIEVNQRYQDMLLLFLDSLKFEDSCRYIVINDKDALYSEAIKNFNEQLAVKADSAGVELYRYDHRIAEEKSADVQDSLSKVLFPNMENVVIIPSNDEPFIADFLGQLYAVKSFYNLKTKVYGPSRWMRMHNIHDDYLFNLGIRIYSPFYVDYSRADVNSFVGRYREEFRLEPTQFSFLGYDLGIYFISMMKKYGADFTPCLKCYKKQMLQSTFKFDSKFGTYKNVNQTYIRYLPSYEVIPVK